MKNKKPIFCYVNSLFCLYVFNLYLKTEHYFFTNLTLENELKLSRYIFNFRMITRTTENILYYIL